jgi:tRNA dimethylallyltransferase
LCSEIAARGRIPFFVGGTGLYINAFFEGLSKVPEVDPAIRENLKLEVSSRGLESLYKELKKVDPESAEKIHQNDQQRIIRSLEV